MRPLTDTKPKPLLEVGGKPLIMFHVEQFARMGVRRLVVNLDYLGEQIQAALGDGSTWNIDIRYSQEPRGALETGGGIMQALDQCLEGPVLVVNGDVWTDLSFNTLSIPPASKAHLILTPNPPHNPRGDFGLTDRRVNNIRDPGWTYAGIGLFRPALFEGCKPGRFPLAPLLRAEAEQGRITGQIHRGGWSDVGTPERLLELDRQLRTYGALGDGT